MLKLFPSSTISSGVLPIYVHSSNSNIQVCSPISGHVTEKLHISALSPAWITTYKVVQYSQKSPCQIFSSTLSAFALNTFWKLLESNCVLQTSHVCSAATDLSSHFNFCCVDDIYNLLIDFINSIFKCSFISKLVLIIFWD